MELNRWTSNKHLLLTSSCETSLIVLHVIKLKNQIILKAYWFVQVQYTEILFLWDLNIYEYLVPDGSTNNDICFWLLTPSWWSAVCWVAGVKYCIWSNACSRCDLPIKLIVRQTTTSAFHTQLMISCAVSERASRSRRKRELVTFLLKCTDIDQLQLTCRVQFKSSLLTIAVLSLLWC